MPSSCAFRKWVSRLVKVRDLEVALALGNKGSVLLNTFLWLLRGFACTGPPPPTLKGEWPPWAMRENELVLCCKK